MAITLDGTNGITTPDLAVDTNTLFVDAANNLVGVGTDNPTTKLDVVSSTNAGIRVSDGTHTGIMFPSAVGGVVYGTTSNHPTVFFSNNAERARISASGELAIGTTNPVLSSKNHRTAIFSSASAVLAVGTAGTAAWNMVTFHNGNGEVGFINTSGTSTSYNTSSDHRLKEDVQPIVGASDRVLSLKPVNFAWKVDGTRVDGFLAHEAQAVVPEAVHGTKDEVDADGNPMYQGIDQSKLVPLLTAALQEALQTIQALEARVAALETPT